IVVRPDLGHWRMINLEGLDLLGEIGGVSADVDYIANAQRSTRFELHGHDREVAVIVGHDADALLHRSRLRRLARRRLDWFRLCPLADWPRLDRDLCGRLGFGACRSAGRRLLLSNRLSAPCRLGDSFFPACRLGSSFCRHGSLPDAPLHLESLRLIVAE